MMQSNMNEFWDPFYQLQKSFDVSDQNSTALISVLTKVKATYENLSNWFKNLSETLHVRRFAFEL